MKKQTFHKTWYFRLLQVIFFGSYIFFAIALILLGMFESDVEISGFVWAAVLAIIYLFIKRIFYYILFEERIIPKISKKR